jgi:hypothetical protein
MGKNETIKPVPSKEAPQRRYGVYVYSENWKGHEDEKSLICAIRSGLEVEELPTEDPKSVGSKLANLVEGRDMTVQDLPVGILWEVPEYLKSIRPPEFYRDISDEDKEIITKSIKDQGFNVIE